MLPEDGFLSGFGLLLSGVAGYLFTSRTAVLKVGASAALLFALGRFLISNIRLHSDFLWFVEALFGAGLLVSSLLLIRAMRSFGHRLSDESLPGVAQPTKGSLQ